MRPGCPARIGANYLLARREGLQRAEEHRLIAADPLEDLVLPAAAPRPQRRGNGSPGPACGETADAQADGGKAPARKPRHVKAKACEDKCP
jgi:hypothetical protein